jgi:hypothetical protein
VGSISGRNAAVLRAIGYLVAATLTALFVAAVAATVLMHWVDPIHWGLWTGHWTFSFGRLDGSTTAQQMSGFAFYLYAIVFASLGGMACREFAEFALAAWRKASLCGARAS